MDLNKFFYPVNVAVVGVSRDPSKVGHVIFRNLLESFDGGIFIVNPKADEILGYKVYSSLLEIKSKIDLCVVAVPAEIVLQIIEDCGKKKIKNVIIVSSGFSEIGNVELSKKLENLLKKYNINCIGPNCIGIYSDILDSLFIPKERMKRPGKGGISFICQSGALSLAVLDLMAEKNYGLSKFISYGNALNVNESDILEYLGKDEETKIICLYVEGIKDGEKFFRVAKEINKPIIAIKGGITKEGSEATLSHTASLAGSFEVYKGVFKQLNIIQANSLEDVFNFARIFEKSFKSKGKRIQIIANGGGYGILTTDSIVKNKLELASLSKESVNILKKEFPKIVTIGNPMDLVGDATTERYKRAIEISLKDKNIDIILVILLYQTPLITPNIIDVIAEFNYLKKKPIVVVSTGGKFTENLMEKLESKGVPCFTFPNNAVKALRALVDYYS